MIIDKIIKLGFMFVNTLVDELKLPDFSIDTDLLASFLNVISGIAYFFPWAYIMPIFGFIVTLQGFRIIIALVKLIRSIIF